MKWFHAIGGSGKTTANVAKMFKDMGWFVTVSDTQFLPPASDIIEDNDIPYQEGYNYRNLEKDFWEEKLGKTLDIPEKPDLCLIMEFLSEKNKEYRYAKLHNIEVYPYSEILAESLIKKFSFVVVGTAGKTTTTNLVTDLLEALGANPSYMIGADSNEFPDGIRVTDSEWSVIEGDEYHNPTLSKGAKFLQYKPKFAVITNVGYEHQDVFPTQEDYTNEFKKFVELVPERGVIVAHKDKVPDEIFENAKAKVIRYSLVTDVNDGEDFWKVVKTEKGGKIFNTKNQEILNFETHLIGDYNLENILASLVLILSLPSNIIPPDWLRYGSAILDILSSRIAKFKGPKKRLEILAKTENTIVIDDFGVVPSRAINSLETLSQEFPGYQLISIFEPNSASRPKSQDEIDKLYRKSLQLSELVIIPTLSEFDDKLISGSELAKAIHKVGVESKYIETPNLEEELREILDFTEKQIFIFFSSYRLSTISENFAKYVQQGNSAE